MTRAPENPELLAAIRSVAERDDAETRGAFYAALLGSTLLLPTDAEAVDARAEGLRLFTTPPADDGSWKLLAFTDAEAAMAWRSDGVTLTSRPAKELFAFAVASPTSGIVLNPGGPAGGELTRREFATLAEGSIPAGSDAIEELRLEPGAQVVVAAPERPPGEAFLGVLRMALDNAGRVRSAWLADVAFEAGELHPAVGVAVDGEPGDEELRAVFDAVMARVQPLLGHGRYLDFVVIDEGWGPLFEAAGPPVYERGAP
ncbi:MAG: enhanced serine sensitivity protein SseB [Actinomycetota bacterium]|nr:enhanced serine sensitivity protein SseB [Actinomycetota bacterium]